MNMIAPLTQNQTEYLYRCKNSWFNVAEGGKRGGKNVLQVLAYCMSVEKHPNKLHLIAGVSTTTAKLNIMDCDGYGLLNYFEGRCREGKYKERACLYVQTKTGEKIILVSGGGKNGDEKLIKGNTYGTAYVTEANECHQNFIQEVFDRTLSSKNRKIFHDLNPKDPNHWYYEDVLDFHAEQMKEDSEYGFNYGHFTIADNLSISDDKLRDILKTYRKGTVWYNRDILGLRCIAEGLIYQQYADDPKKWEVEADEEYTKDGMFISVGVDFGGNKSKTSYVATMIHRGYKKITYLEDHSINFPSGTIDGDVVNRETVTFLQMLKDKYPNHTVKYLFGDNATPYLINGIKKALRVTFPNVSVGGCDKNAILDRIWCTNTLLNTDRLFVNKTCKGASLALQQAVWDENKPDTRLDDFTSDIDTIDASEYSWERFMKKLIPSIKK